MSNEYVALLRGINAGGKRRVPMADLRKLFEELGYSKVKTYVNSGNVLFKANKAPTSESLTKELTVHFGFEIPTLVLNEFAFKQVAKAIPADWQNDYQKHKSDVCFLFPAIDSPEIIKQIGQNSEIETIRYVKGAVLSNLLRKNQPKSSLFKLVGTPLYQRMTVRNITTVRKLAVLLKENK
ncbi:MAG: DUF1697 domain-containing protein [Micrococcaceae bacterium]